MKKKSTPVWVERCQGVLRIKELFKKGYFPARGSQSYLAVCKSTNEAYSHQINCFAHACLNLTNEQLEQLNLDRLDRCTFDIKTYQYEPQERIEQTFTKRVKRFGLEAHLCERNFLITKQNQWKVALYFGTSPRTLDVDYHFLKQEKNGVWTSKVSWGLDEIECFDSLPDTYYSPSGVEYHLHNTYIITNPYIEKTNQKNISKQNITDGEAEERTL